MAIVPVPSFTLTISFVLCQQIHSLDFFLGELFSISLLVVLLSGFMKLRRREAKITSAPLSVRQKNPELSLRSGSFLGRH